MIYSSNILLIQGISINLNINMLKNTKINELDTEMIFINVWRPHYGLNLFYLVCKILM
jgi:hypothetical protein